MRIIGRDVLDGVAGIIFIGMQMLTVESVTVVLGARSVLADFSCSVVVGEKVALLGESGSGKSTLLKTCIGMYQPSEGSITIGGLPMVPSHLHAIRKQMFYLPQDIIPFGEESVYEYLQYPFLLGINKTITVPRDRIADLFDQARLPRTLLDQPMYKASGGERKRIGIVAGLLLRRPLMLLDEPTAGVDAGNRNLVADLLCSLKETTVVVVTHDDTLLSRFGRTIPMTITMQEGCNGSA